MYLKKDRTIMDFIEDVKKKFTSYGRQRVFKDCIRLSPEHLIDKAKPKAFTKENLIEVILKKLRIKFERGKYFVDRMGTKIRADYYLTNARGDNFLAQAKPINHYLHAKGPDGAINKIRRLFRILEVRDKFKFGIATDGLTWIFIDKKGIVCGDKSIKRDYRKIKDILKGKKVIDSDHFDEETLKAWERAFD